MKHSWKILTCNALLAGLAYADDVPGWHRVGSAREDFEIRLDREVHHGGTASGMLECTKKRSKGTGTLEQDFRPEEYSGRRIRMRAWIKGEDAGRVMIYIRSEGPSGEILDFANTQLHAGHGTFDWRLHELVIDVPPESTVIQVGLILGEKGKAWMDDVSVEAVDRNVSRTGPPFSSSQANPRRAGIVVDHPALNLDFEQSPQ